MWKFDEFLYEQLESDKYYIYTLADPIDGEIKYVGKSKDLKNRLSRHMSTYSLKDAWTSKNKWLSWLKNQGLTPIIEILDEGDINNIDDLEIYWIEQIKNWGYKLKNDTKGGKGCEYWTGKNLSDEHKKNTKMHNPLRREVCEYEIGTDKLLAEYISVREAAEKTKHKYATISDSCKGKSSPYKFGCYWRYKNDYFPYVERDLKQSEESKLKSKMNNPLRKDILQYTKNGELVGEYDSSYEAEEKTGITRNNIVRCCKGIKNYNSAGGFIWKFKNNI